MFKLCLHVFAALIIPAVFSLYYIDAGNAEGWGGWAYGVALGSLLVISFFIGLALAIICFIRWWKLKQDWYLYGHWTC